MSSSFRKTVEKLNEQSEGRLACSGCSTATPQAILAQYGGQCTSCFTAWAEQRGHDGFLQGKPDTIAQAEMRARLKADRPTGQSMAKAEPAKVQQSQGMAERIRDYAKRNGISLADAQTLLDSKRHQPPTRTRVSSDEPEWVR